MELLLNCQIEAQFNEHLKCHKKFFTRNDVKLANQSNNLLYNSKKFYANFTSLYSTKHCLSVSLSFSHSPRTSSKLS
jgi:hypothetical protein